jgi:hypothetical protein
MADVESMKPDSAGWVRVERGVRHVKTLEPPEHAARLVSGGIVYAIRTMLTNPKEGNRSYCLKPGDGPMDDVDRSLIMPGAENAAVWKRQ